MADAVESLVGMFEIMFQVLGREAAAVVILRCYEAAGQRAEARRRAAH